MIVTAQPKAPIRWHLVVAAIAFCVGVVWQSSTSMNTPTTPEKPDAPGVALLATGSSADAWIEPVVAGGSGRLLGFRLVDVRPGSAWDRAGMKNDDVVTAVNGEPVVDLSRVLIALTGTAAAGVRFERDGVTFSATLSLH